MQNALPPGKPAPVALRLRPWTEFGASDVVDYHMHTAHTDGTASPREMADAAATKNVGEVLFSEHVRHTSTYYPSFVDEVKQLRYKEMGIKVGIETKIFHKDGWLDCSPELAALCDAIVGSVHSAPPDDTGALVRWSELEADAAVELELELALAIVKKSRAHILGHPMGMAVTRFNLQPVEQLRELAAACQEYDKAFELNPRYCTDVGAWVDIVREAGCRVSFGSDAHRTADVGTAWQRFGPQEPFPL